MSNFTLEHNLGVVSHSQIDFVDILVDGDIPLYLDSDLIAADKSPVGLGAAESISSFFNALFEACRNENYQLVYKLLSYGREPNETHLGMSSGISRGKGTSTHILFPIFKDMIIRGYFKQGLIVQPSDIVLWTPNFERDRMSDLLINVIRQDLFLFTIQQYAHLHLPIPAASDMPYQGNYWDSKLRRWCSTTGWPALTTGNFPILLVPKTFVCRNLLASPGAYLQKYVLKYRQEKHLDDESSLCPTKEDKDGNIIFLKPPKKLIREVEINGGVAKDYTRQYTLENPNLLHHFHTDNHHRATHGNAFLSDAELDYIVYVTTRKAE